MVRFAAELGFDGYPQLQKAMQELIRSKLTTVQRIEVTRARMADDEVLDNVMAYDMANIRQTLEELPRDVFYQAVDAIVEARRVYIFGAGSCRALANFLAYYLKLLLPDIHLIYTSSETEILEEMLQIGEQDAIIGLSFPRYSSKAGKDRPLRTFPPAKNHCRLQDAVLCPYSGVRVLSAVGAQRYGHHRGFLGRAAEYYQRLLVAVSLKKMDSNAARLTELEQLWETYQVFQPFEEVSE